MDFVGFATCHKCGVLLGTEPWDVCVICSGLFCAAHLMRRQDVLVCDGCESDYQAHIDASAIADADHARVVTLLLEDLAATVGRHFDHIVLSSAARYRLFAQGPTEFEQRVVDDVQQRLHDEFIDTTWPACPTHACHPLWFSEGYWRCERTGQVVARLGELNRALGNAS